MDIETLISTIQIQSLQPRYEVECVIVKDRRIKFTELENLETWHSHTGAIAIP